MSPERDQEDSQIGRVWHFVLRVLRDRAWTGTGVLVGMLALILQMMILTGRLAYIPDQPGVTTERPAEIKDKDPIEVTPPVQDTAPDAQELVDFSVHKRVRCPGGGDWLGRERNYRRAVMKFDSPKGTWIDEDYTEFEVVTQNHGEFGKIKYSTSFVHGDVRNTRLELDLWCDPPDYPGAPGGWMEISLYGKHTAPPND